MGSQQPSGAGRDQEGLPYRWYKELHPPDSANLGFFSGFVAEGPLGGDIASLLSP